MVEKSTCIFSFSSNNFEFNRKCNYRILNRRTQNCMMEYWYDPRSLKNKILHRHAKKNLILSKLILEMVGDQLKTF